MQGNQTIIDYLNTILKNELTAINQYFLHAKMFQNWGYVSLANKEKEESIDEMKHADQIIERILFLEGLPNLQSFSTLKIGTNVQEALQSDLNAELQALKDLKETIHFCESHQDYITRDLAQSILKSEEEHIDWLETELSLIESLGIKNYLQKAI